MAAKRRNGRPITPVDRLKHVTLTIVMSRKLREQVEERALKEGRSLSDLGRALLEQSLRDDKIERLLIAIINNQKLVA